MMDWHPAPAKTRQHGVSLLEVLIALLVLSVAALGFAALQLTALANSSEANHRAHAALIAQDAVERIQTNPSELGSYVSLNGWDSREFSEGTAPPNSQQCTSSGPCTGPQMADWDMDQLSWMVANALPLGRVLVQSCPFSSSTSCVIVSWDDQQPSDCVSAAGVVLDTTGSCFVMEVVL